jgi:hypothetical protein
MQYFIFVRDRACGQIVHREILHEGAELPPFESDFWLQAGDRERELAERFPGGHVVRASASSLEAFLENHPEYGPVV